MFVGSVMITTRHCENLASHLLSKQNWLAMSSALDAQTKHWMETHP